MGPMDKFLRAMRIGDDEYESYEDDYDDYDEAPQPTRRAEKSVPAVRGGDYQDIEEKPIRKPAKVTPLKAASNRKVMGNGSEVCVIKPTNVDDAREITETLLADRTVVLNLEGLDVDVAQRIIDFTSGSTFAIKGNLQKISNYIFIVTPASVDISGDFQEMLSGSFSVGNR